MKTFDFTPNWLLAIIAVISISFASCQKEDDFLPNEKSGSVTNSTQRVAPAVPALLEVPAGNVVSFMTYATGFQVYTCTQTAPGVFAWVFTAPEADLYANAGFNGGGVGIHFAGPTWESNSGSSVVGTRLQGVSVNSTAIPWLLLGAVTSQGPGVFDGTTYIQRVNTTGGLAPVTGADASTLGQQVRVPYTAEYFFYRAE